MKNCLSILLLLVLTTTQCLAALEKVYNAKGERIGSVRKNGDSYEWYDMNDNKVESYQDLSGGEEIFVGSPGKTFNSYSYDPYHYYISYPYYYIQPHIPVRPPQVIPPQNGNIPAYPSTGVKVIKTGHSYYN